MQGKKIRIISCRNSRLWYSKYIEEEFFVVKDEFDVYWCNEPDDWNALNFVIKEDAELVEA
jgi:hypothetical protein